MGLAFRGPSRWFRGSFYPNSLWIKNILSVLSFLHKLRIFNTNPNYQKWNFFKSHKCNAFQKKAGREWAVGSTRGRASWLCSQRTPFTGRRGNRLRRDLTPNKVRPPPLHPPHPRAGSLWGQVLPESPWVQVQAAQGPHGSSMGIRLWKGPELSVVCSTERTKTSLEYLPGHAKSPSLVFFSVLAQLCSPESFPEKAGSRKTRRERAFCLFL